MCKLHVGESMALVISGEMDSGSMLTHRPGIRSPPFGVNQRLHDFRKCRQRLAARSVGLQ